MHRMTCPRYCSNDSLIKLIDAIQAHCKLIHIKEKGAGITAFVQTLRRALLACLACTKQAYLWLLCGDDGDGSSSTGALTKSSFNTCTTPQSRRNLLLMKQLGTLRQGQSSRPPPYGTTGPRELDRLTTQIFTRR